MKWLTACASSESMQGSRKFCLRGQPNANNVFCSFFVCWLVEERGSKYHLKRCIILLSCLFLAVLWSPAGKGMTSFVILQGLLRNPIDLWFPRGCPDPLPPPLDPCMERAVTDVVAKSNTVISFSGQLINLICFFIITLHLIHLFWASS